ncbi:hypothetical protein AVEN_121089-1 [Araneus ventricosus]|uniref:Uncharacterized protein n=1 Tax=Araneus ventricosus TaxID=182803 RepID=A0A4Y2US83_ARAVE|nr:hypothetical protein AVEN_20808-1 [Araneus ventricosus]GBO15061.1 hypothetical protein AVEN_121089-1 [Araneus ventricosus]
MGGDTRRKCHPYFTAALTLRKIKEKNAFPSGRLGFEVVFVVWLIAYLPVCALKNDKDGRMVTGKMYHKKSVAKVYFISQFALFLLRSGSLKVGEKSLTGGRKVYQISIWVPFVARVTSRRSHSTCLSTWIIDDRATPNSMEVCLVDFVGERVEASRMRSTSLSLMVDHLLVYPEHYQSLEISYARTKCCSDLEVVY